MNIRDNEENKEQQKNTAKDAIKKNFIRDVGLIKQGVLESFKRHLALKRLFEDISEFSFALPLMKLDESEDKKFIYNSYYDFPNVKEKSDWLGDYRYPIIRKAFIAAIGKDLAFTKSSVDENKGKAFFNVELPKKVPKKASSEEFRKLTSALDLELAKALQLNKILQSHVNRLYDTLKTCSEVEVLPETFESLPLVEEDISAALKKACDKILMTIGITGRHELNVSAYIENSSYLNILKESFESLGYGLHYSCRDNRLLNISLEVTKSTDIKRTDDSKIIPSSQDFLELIELKSEEFQMALEINVKKQAKNVKSYIESGKLDHVVLKELKEFCLRDGHENWLEVLLEVPFTRNLIGYKSFCRTESEAYGTASRYMQKMNEKDGLKTLLEKRYPPFKYGAIFYSRATDGIRTWRGSKRKEDCLCFCISFAYPNEQARESIMEFINENTTKSSA